MKARARFAAVLTLTVGLAVPSTAYAYQTLANGQLFFNGYQTSDKVVSEIGDTNYSDSNKFNVEAIVYVGNTRYSSGWKRDYAYKSANRSFWHNEKSRYNYTRR